MQNEIRQNATDTLKDYIRALAASGLSLIPIADSEKKPHPILGAKHDLLKRPPTDKELDAWLGRGITSWAVASGAVSGNLVVLDFDEKHHPGLYDRWYDKLSDDQKAVVATCPISKTRNNGKHVRYRTETPQPTTKLSRRVIKEKIETTSETRGEGAYALIPPSPGYELIQGNLLDLPLITDEMHEEFVDVLRIFNEVEDKPATEYEWVPGTVVDGDRPGDSFNKFATWEEILEPHGWVQESKDRWRRPGKKDGEGISATTNHAGVPMLYVFSSAAAPFEQNKGFSKFHAYALLEHGGDFKAAARAAAEKYPATESDGNTERYATLLESVPKNIGKENIISALKPLLEALADEKSLPEAELYIRSIIKDKCGLTSRDVDSIIKYFKEWRKPIQAKKEAERIKTEQTKTEPPPTEEERRAAEQILKSPMLLYDVLQMVKNLGVVGEEKNILLHYIIFTSRNLENPLSATVKGDSSSGKSYTLLTTMKLFPKSAYIDLTDATPQSFYYCPEDHFKHRIIVLFEKHGGERADYAIRTLQSEGKLKIQVTVKNADTGAFEANIIEKEGPTGFVTTTTASLIHAENDTRNISMFPDQSPAQTSRVYASVDARFMGAPKLDNTALKPWHHAQVILEQLPVFIPFAASFRKYFPANIVRTRRDYGHFLAIVETVAFLHQKQRETVEMGGQKYIRATLADAYMAKVIVEESLSKSIYELPEKTIEVIRAARELLAKSSIDFSSGENTEEPTFTITGLAKHLGWDRDTVAKWLKPAGKKGYVTQVADSKGSKGAEYKVEEKELPSDEFLPTIEQLAADNPLESIEGIYDPVTGETIVFERTGICTDMPTPIEVAQNTRVSDDPTCVFLPAS